MEPFAAAAAAAAAAAEGPVARGYAVRVVAVADETAEEDGADVAADDNAAICCEKAAAAGVGCNRTVQAILPAARCIIVVLEPIALMR